MINKELFYKVTLIDCNGKELEVAKFLQILTGMEKTETRRIVASLPCVLYEELDREACSYIERRLRSVLRLPQMLLRQVHSDTMHRPRRESVRPHHTSF